VLVRTLVAVVCAVQPVQVVHGALVPQGPLVQPDHVLPGQSLSPHHAVQGPLCHGPLLAQGPHSLVCPPKGQPPDFQGPPFVVHVVQSEFEPQGPFVPQGPLLQEPHPSVPVGQGPPEVGEKVASGPAVIVAPVLAQAWAMNWYIVDLSESLHDDFAMQEFALEILLSSAQKPDGSL